MIDLRDDNLLVSFVDGELDTETARQIEAKIAADAATRQRVRLFRETAAWMRSAYLTELANPDVGADAAY
jgi:anti-sigma factor RsiW